MGVSTNLHIGPYLVVDHKMVEEDEKWRCPTSKKHKRALGQKFCSQCGAKFKSETVEKERWILPWDVEEFGIDEESFVHTDPMGCIKDKPPIWLPNHHLPGDFPDIEDGGVAEVSPEAMDAVMVAFNERYADAIQKLRDAGVEFEIKFGVIVWFN